ncbi:unnamed protein product [Fraxinus pennsylvanica]|uniref:Uncharacterized protein n=1 Tax=Fraxinus pennsylvanica TaxID=56036 RepID=A0AAD2EB63_9LAMI|nr:unnamed protein product [Fraxinus pennsylvanica]
MGILKVIFFVFLQFLVINARNHCKSHFCGSKSFEVRFPFQLQGGRLQNCGYPSFILDCSIQRNRAVLNIRYSGDFHVRDMDYLKQEIQLMDLNLSSSPFMADYYQSYTFLRCPSDFTRSRFTTINCLSNSTIYVSNFFNEFCQGYEHVHYNCYFANPSFMAISVSEIPSDLDDDLKLTWNDPDCVDCEEKGGICGFENNTSREIHVFWILEQITSSKNISSLPSFDYKEEAASDHGRVKAISLGRQQLENCESINLKCSNEDITILNLPYSEEFFVQDIYYDEQEIQVYDPNNCLPRWLLNLNLSSSPLMAIEYQTYTFYSCPRELLLGSEFKVIDCLSNSTSATIASSFVPQELMEQVYKCKIIYTSSIPVSWLGQLDHWGTDSNLLLAWKDLSCKDCEGKFHSKVPFDNTFHHLFRVLENPICS